MKIKLIKRRDATEKGPMTVMIEHDGSKKFFNVDTNQTIDVQDEIGFLILGDKRFTGLFEQVHGKQVIEASKPAHAAKSVAKNYPNKALATESTKAAVV